MLASTESSVIYPVAIIKGNCIKCRALLDTGSGNSYASEAIIDLLKKKNAIHILCNPQKSSVNVCLMKKLKSTVTKKVFVRFYNLGEKNF